MASTAARFKAVLLLLVHYLLLLPFCMGALCFVMYFFFYHLADEERAGCFTLIVFLLWCGCLCLFSVSLPNVAVS